MRNVFRSLSKIRCREFVGELSSVLDRKYGLKRLACRTLSVNYAYFRKYCHQKRGGTLSRHKRALKETTENSVQEFYGREDISTEMPNRKAVKDQRAKKVLQISTKRAYEQFCSETDQQISLSKFRSLRPTNVQLQRNARLYQCLCEKCENIEHKEKALNHYAIHFNEKAAYIVHKYNANDITLCSGEHTSMNCIDRKCELCGTGQMTSHLQGLLDRHGAHEVTWKRWGKRTFSDGRERPSLLVRSGTLRDLHDELIVELEAFSAHLFHARWQQHQFVQLTREPPERTLVCVEDFAENFTCIRQREIQSAHWYQEQVTLHPLVFFYRCDKCPSEEGNVVRESVVIVSDDRVHDSHAAQHYTEIGVTHIDSFVPFLLI